MLYDTDIIGIIAMILMPYVIVIHPKQGSIFRPHPRAVSTCGYARVHYTLDCPAWGVLTGLYPTRF